MFIGEREVKEGEGSSNSISLNVLTVPPPPSGIPLFLILIET
jgi:hypothetical protein